MSHYADALMFVFHAATMKTLIVSAVEHVLNSLK
jgi:hypothetical protein